MLNHALVFDNATQYFDATTLLELRNTNSPTVKRIHDFTHGVRFKNTFELTALQLGRAAYSTRGGGIHKRTWMHLSLLPLYLQWLSPAWYAAVFANAHTPRLMAALGQSMRLPSAADMFDQEAMLGQMELEISASEDPPLEAYPAT